MRLPQFALVCCSVAALAAAQQTASESKPAVKLPLKANLVLTPEFCATKLKKGSALSGKETFAVGEASCPKLEEALGSVFSSLTKFDKVPDSGSAPGQVTLIPKFIDVGATKTLWAKSKRELVILIEWTVQDATGKPVWVQTVEGSAHNKAGNVFSAGKHRREIVDYAAEDVAHNSAQKIAAAPELSKLTQ